MAKLVSKSKSNGKTATTTKKTVNKAGGVAFELKDRERLVTGILTCFVNEPKFYGDTSKELIDVARKLIGTDPEFVARAAVFARKEFHMRTISQVLAAEVAKGATGNPIVRKMTRGVIERPDDITNIIAYHLYTWGERKKGNAIPRSLRRGIADAFHKFNEYHLAKYKGLEDDVKLRDALLIARPAPQNKEQADLWKRLIENKLETPETRETILSEKGQSKEVWENFIDSGKMGYMAMLRNLKNMLEHNISSKHIEKVAVALSNKEAVLRSKQLPFRFFMAYKMIDTISSTKVSKIKDALEEALTISFENLPRLSGTTAIITDESGSMCYSNVSLKSGIRLIDIGNLLGAVAQKFCENSLVVPFGDTAKVLTFSSKTSVFDNIHKLEHAGVGHSTNLDQAFKAIEKSGEKVDRILIFSDMQCYKDTYENGANAFTARLRKNNPNMWVHSIDLQGHGTTKVCGNKINLISGWSDKVLDYVYQVENGGDSLVETISKYHI